MKAMLLMMYPPTPLLEIGLDIACNHLESGDEVYILRCNGELETCPDNWEHRRNLCILCKSKHNNGFKVLGLSKKHVRELPQIDLSYDDIPKIFDTIEELKNYSHDGVDIGLATASSLISNCRDHKPRVREHSKWIYASLKANIYVYMCVLRELSGIKPDVFYAFNGRTSIIRSAIRACEKMRVSFYTYDVAATTNRYGLYKNDTVFGRERMKEEMLELWDRAGQNKEKEGEEFFYNNRNLKRGKMHFLFVKDQRINLLPDGFDRSYKNITIFNSSMDEFEALEDWKSPIYKDQNDGIRRILDAFNDEEKIRFYLRVHPYLKGRSNNSQMRETIEICAQFKNIVMIPAESPVHTYSLIDNSDVVITFGSTVGVEACFWNKPSILLGRSFYEFLDCCYKPSTHEEVVRLLRSDLSPKSREEALKYGYWVKYQGVPFKRFEHTYVWDPDIPIPHQGRFLGKEIRYGRFARNYVRFLRLLDVKHYPELMDSIKRHIRRLVNTKR